MTTGLIQGITGIADIQPVNIATFPDAPVAEGSISLDSSTGTLTIQGTDTHDDTVLVYVNHRGGPYSDLLTVALSNINLPRVAAYDPSEVTKIVFYGYGGNDTFDNRTSRPVFADGGAGTDMLLGGSGNDYFLG